MGFIKIKGWKEGNLIAQSQKTDVVSTEAGIPISTISTPKHEGRTLFSEPIHKPQPIKYNQPAIVHPRSIEAYTNRLNELLIQNPMDANRFTVYPDFDSYNRRLLIPESRSKNTIEICELTPVSIDPEKLITLSTRDTV